MLSKQWKVSLKSSSDSTNHILATSLAKTENILFPLLHLSSFSFRWTVIVSYYFSRQATEVPGGDLYLLQ